MPKTVSRRKRLGRGIGKRGAKSGRGMKGQRSRAGYTARAGFEGGQTPLYQRLPKGRGAKRKFASRTVKPYAVKTQQLNCFAKDDVVGTAALKKAGLVPARQHSVKLIKKGDLKRKLTVRVHAATAGAVFQVEQAGGKVEIIRRNKR